MFSNDNYWATVILSLIRSTIWGTLQIRQAKGEPGQASVPTPTLETNMSEISLIASAGTTTFVLLFLLIVCHDSSVKKCQGDF